MRMDAHRRCVIDECYGYYQFASGHTSSITPGLIRTRKLSGERPGQYWGGGPPGKPFGCCWLFCGVLPHRKQFPTCSSNASENCDHLQYCFQLTWLALGYDHEDGSGSAEQVTALRRL